MTLSGHFSNVFLAVLQVSALNRKDLPHEVCGNHCRAATPCAAGRGARSGSPGGVVVPPDRV